jgi:hypothetical protein
MVKAMTRSERLGRERALKAPREQLNELADFYETMGTNNP